MMMDLDTIERFLSESTKQQRWWESIRILGGEPTLHPGLEQMVGMIEAWCQAYSPECSRYVVSNGYGTNARKVLARLPGNWIYTGSFKDERYVAHFEPFNKAPIDYDAWKNEDFTKGCWICSDCGSGLTPLGYFPCAVSGGIERVFRQGLGFRSLPPEHCNMDDILERSCRYCGHFFNDIYAKRTERFVGDPDFMTKSWKQAYSHAWDSKSS
ncbi:hypothetical protein [Desulfatiferula olefinivorans]